VILEMPGSDYKQFGVQKPRWKESNYETCKGGQADVKKLLGEIN
jgi:hypothetical protein